MYQMKTVAVAGYKNQWAALNEIRKPVVKELNMALYWFAEHPPEPAELILPPGLPKWPGRRCSVAVQAPANAINALEEILPNYGIEKRSTARFAFVFHVLSTANQEEIAEYYMASMVTFRTDYVGELARHLNSCCDESRSPEEYMIELLRADMEAKRST